MKMIAAALLLSLSIPAVAAAPRSAPPKAAGSREEAIPFVSREGILDWRAAGEDALYIHASNGKWYFVRTSNSCPRLTSAVTLGFVTSALDQLDRHGAILAEGDRCPVASIVRSAPPPKRHRR